MAYTLSGNTINDITVYLTQIGKERLLTGTNFTIKRFGIGDSDINYLDSNLIPMGLVPDISGDNLGCVKSLSSAVQIKNFIEKDGIPKSLAYITYSDILSSDGNSSFTMKLLFSKKINKNVNFKFKVVNILETPQFSNTLLRIDILKNNVVINTFNNVSDFNDYTFLLPINNLQTDDVRFTFSNDLLLLDKNRQINLLLDVETNSDFTLVETKILIRKNATVVKPKILNVIPILNNGKYFFNVILENLSYSYPLKYKILGLPFVISDISYSNGDFLMEGKNSIGYSSGNYTIVVEDSFGNTDQFSINIASQLTVQLETINNSFKITTFGGTNVFSYKLFKIGVTIPIFVGNVNVSNSVVLITTLTNGDYYAEITDSGVTVISQTITVILQANRLTTTLIKIDTLSINLDVSNVTQLGNHVMTLFESADNITFTLLKTISINFIGNSQYFYVSRFGLTKFYYKSIITTSYGDTDILLFTNDNNMISRNIQPTQNDGCFALDTKIKMEDNSYKLIKDINIGDRLKSFSFNNYISSDDKKEYMNWSDNKLDLTEEVTIVKSKTNKSMSYYYEINNTQMSFDHPMLVSRDNLFLFLEAKNIISGDYFIDIKGDKILVEKSVRKNIKLDVISIDVEPFNLYIANNYLTHNKLSEDGGIIDGGV